MLKYIKFAIFTLFLFLAKPSVAQENTVDVYFFYGDGCPHCAKEEIFLNKIEAENKNIKTHRYETWYNKKNRQFLKDLGVFYSWRVQGVPFTVVGDKTISGYYNDEITGAEILQAIDAASLNQKNLVGDYLNQKYNPETDQGSEGKEKINVPIMGQLDLKKISLPLFTVVIAALDGLNPCALWVLVFLISMLVGLRDRKKLFILGSTFILASGIFYYLVLAAWVNFLSFIGYIDWIRIAIGVVAIYCGFYYIKKWKDQNKKCEIIDEVKRKKILDRAKEVVSENKLPLAVIGVGALSISVGLFELVCSAGLPVVYTNVLAMSNLPAWQYYAYLFFYVLVFKVYEIAILAIALSTLKIQAINPKTILRVGLIGGMAMLIIGLLLLFKSDWLLFG